MSQITVLTKKKMDFDVENEKAAQKDHIFTANVMTQRKDKDKSF
jgi:hypothetical protein